MRHSLPIMLVLTLAATAWSSPGVAQPRVTVEIDTSEMLSLVYFARAAGGEPNRSDELYAVWAQNASETQKDAVARMSSALRTAPALTYNLEGVSSRHNGTSIDALLEGHAGASTSLDDLSRRIAGLLPVDAHAEVIAGLREVAPIHREHVWKAGRGVVEAQARALRKLAAAHDLDRELTRAARFYGSTWPADLPLRIYLVPRPAGSGPTYGHAAGSVAVVETFDGDDPAARLAVVFHEICHSLYGAQSLDRQLDLHEAFARHPALVAATLASGQLNEALATAIGTGVFERKLRGDVVDGESWYADPIVDAYAKALAPLVGSYFGREVSMDATFVDYAVLALVMRLPDVTTNPRALFGSAFLGMTKGFDPHELMQAFRARFRSKMLYNGLPLSHERTFAHWGRRLPTVLVVHPDRVEELRDYPRDLRDGVATAFASHDAFTWTTLVDGRPVIVVGAKDDATATQAFEAAHAVRIAPGAPVPLTK